MWKYVHNAVALQQTLELDTFNLYLSDADDTETFIVISLVVEYSCMLF